MTAALLTLNLVSLAFLGVTAFYGHHIPEGGGALGRHLNFALVATFLAVFAQTMTLFYFIGVGSSIKKSLGEADAASLIAKNKEIKGRVMPWASGAGAVLMVTFILGGAAHTRALPGWVHGGLGYFALAVTALAVVVETYFLFKQNYVINEFNREWIARHDVT